jgi:hypothetical protein
MLLTGTPRVNTNKHTVVSKRLIELIVEGRKYVRMKCRKNITCHQFNKKRAQTSKVTLEKRTCPEKKKEDVWSPYHAWGR